MNVITRKQQFRNKFPRKLTRQSTFVGLLVLLIIVGLIWQFGIRNSGDQITSSSGVVGQLTRESTDAQITIQATLQSKTPALLFQIAMNTHVVNLDSFDLKGLAILRTDQGREVKPVDWQSAAGGHHRTGVLTFPLTTDNNQPLIDQSTQYLELIIRGVGVPERILKWVL